MVVVGETPRGIDAAAAKMIEDDGDEAPFRGYPSGRQGEKFPGVICVSVNDTIVHAPGTWNDTPFAEGDVVSIDFGVQHKGLITDSARTVIVGSPRNPEEAQLVSVAYEALQAGIDQARVGNTTGDIGFAVQQFAERYGYGYPKHLSGHGVGLSIQSPAFVRRSRTRVQVAATTQAPRRAAASRSAPAASISALDEAHGCVVRQNPSAARSPARSIVDEGSSVSASRSALTGQAPRGRSSTGRRACSSPPTSYRRPSSRRRGAPPRRGRSPTDAPSSPRRSSGPR
jgi:hypothetical protein